MMETAVSLIAIGLNLLLLLFAIKKIDASNALGAVVTTSELVLVIISILLLGLWGIPVAAAILTVSILILSLRSAIAFETLCASCSIYGSFGSKEEAATYIRELRRSHEAYGSLDLIGLARLVLRLSERQRTPDEIRDMAAPIAMLAAINHRDPLQLADKIDTTLRKWGKPASETMHVADVLIASAQQSPSTFDEMLDGMASF